MSVEPNHDARDVDDAVGRAEACRRRERLDVAIDGDHGGRCAGREDLNRHVPETTGPNDDRCRPRAEQRQWPLDRVVWDVRPWFASRYAGTRRPCSDGST